MAREMPSSSLNAAAVRVVTTSRSSVLRRLVNEAPPELLRRNVLDRLPPEDRAMLSRVDRACAARPWKRVAYRWQVTMIGRILFLYKLSRDSREA